MWNKTERKGKVDQAKGKVKQAVGSLTGNHDLKAEGHVDETARDRRPVHSHLRLGTSRLPDQLGVFARLGRLLPLRGLRPCLGRG